MCIPRPPRGPRHPGRFSGPGRRLAGQQGHRPIAGVLADRGPDGQGHVAQHQGWGDLHRLGRRRRYPGGHHHHQPLRKPELWTSEEAAEPALYAHKITVDRAYGGQGLGAEPLDWAGTRAADEGADWLRVDVWTTNERLQHYYLKQSFTYVRTVALPHNPSGALFQRPAQRLPTPHLEEVESLTG
jgi:GNAT superfamily N-acetyltransferase